MGSAPAGTSVLDDLADAVDGAAREATAQDAVAGVQPRWVATPDSTEQAARLLAVAARLGCTVTVRGRGTALHWGPPPRSADLVVSTERLAGIVEHEAGDLVCTVGAGTRIDDLNAAVAEAGQQLALDQPVRGASVGGTLSTTRSGPRRMLYGTPRDLVLGVTMVRPDGVSAKAGGKVVKNVAGYDLAKLLGGAYGTLGLVTRMVVRLHPLPVASRWLVAGYDDPAAAAAAALRVAGSPIAPSAVEVARAADAAVTEVLVLLEGTERGVEERRTAAAVLLETGARGTPVDGERDSAEVADLDTGPDDAVVKLAVPLTGVGPLLVGAARLEQRLDLPCRIQGSAGAGVLYAVLPQVAGREQAVAEAVSALRSMTAGGSTVLLQAPTPVRQLVDSWGPVPALDLMRRLKHEFDPDHRFAPGRFVGGI